MFDKCSHVTTGKTQLGVKSRKCILFYDFMTYHYDMYMSLCSYLHSVHDEEVNQDTVVCEGNVFRYVNCNTIGVSILSIIDFYLV